MYKIYKITNDVNDKLYIGMTSKSLKVRLRGHFSKMNSKGNEPSPFQKEIKRIGKKHFKIDLIVQTKDKDKAYDLERYYIKKYKTVENGYNTLRGGKGIQLLSDDYYENMIDIFHTTKSIRETAKIIGKAEGTISRQLTYIGIDKGMYSRLTCEEKTSIRIGYKNGLSFKEISKQLGKNPETIKRYIKELLYPPQTNHKKYAHDRALEILELNKSFNSIKECCEFLIKDGVKTNINTCKSHVVRCLNGERKTYKGFHYVDRT